MKNFIKKINVVVAAYESAKDSLTNELESELGKWFSEVMSDSDVIHSFRFNQFCPHFNDGEACEFRVNHQYGYFFGQTNYDQDGEEIEFADGDEFDEYSCHKISAKDINRMKTFKELLGKIPDDFYNLAFGDSSEITIYRDGSVLVDDDLNHD